MKQLIAIAALLLFTTVTKAQDIPASNVPSVVLNTFNKAFPGALKIEWEMKAELYNAEFKLNRREHEVWINPKGAIVKHKKELRSAELPAAVANSIKQNYKGLRIDDVDRYEEGKQFFYKIELKKLGQPDQKVVLDSKGKLVNRVF